MPPPLSKKCIDINDKMERFKVSMACDFVSFSSRSHRMYIIAAEYYNKKIE